MNASRTLTLRRGAFTAFAVSLLLAAWWAAAASAAVTYYVSPQGSGNECSQAKPCNIVFGLGSAGSGDTIVIAGNEGSYGLPENPTLENFNVPSGVTVDGAAGQPRPKIYAGGVNYALQLGFGAKLTFLEIHYRHETGGGEALYAQGSNTIERVFAEGTNNAAGCLTAPNVTIVDSICSGTYGIFDFVGGGGSWPLTLRNDTIYAEQTGLDLGSNGPAMTITATNTIVHGGSNDIFAVDQGNGGHVSVTLSHSNYAKVTTETGASVTAASGGTNQTSAPQFANAAAGDFHEHSGSPTIDAGVNEAANGLLDLDGNQRTLSAKLVCGATEAAITDIGAFEFVPLAPTCGSERSTPAAERPNTKISKEKIRGHAVTFRFRGSGPGPLNFECKLDKRRFTSCRSPKSYRHLKAGRHRFRVRAVDAAGVDPSPASRTFRIKVGPR